MSALIAGLDISSKAIHAALIPLDPDDGSDAPPVTLRSFDLTVFKPASTTPAYRRVERCRVIREGVRELLYKVRFPEPFGGTAAEYLDRQKLCEGRTLEESSHYGGYVRCHNRASYVAALDGQFVALCGAHRTSPESAPRKVASAEVVHVCIEEPFGSVSRSTVLWEILGAILATIPPHIERDTITTHEWRRIAFGAISFPSWKAAATLRAALETDIAMNEHEAEAYLIARACRTRLEKAVAT